MTRALNSKYKKSFELKLGAISWCNTLKTLVQHVEVWISSSEFDCRKASTAAGTLARSVSKNTEVKKCNFPAFGLKMVCIQRRFC